MVPVTEFCDHVTLPGLRATPISDAAQALIRVSKELGTSRAASMMRAWCVAHLFAQRERLFDSGEDPVPAFRAVLIETASLLVRLRETGFAGLGAESAPAEAQGERVAFRTGEHYGNLFQHFSAESYFEEALELLRQRLERNGIDVAALAGRAVVDVGCGGGRYTAAWRRLGAKPAFGVDISPVNIEDARRRAREAGMDEIHFEVADVLDLLFPADRFDIVFSNGVLHHTTDWRRGVRELVRVLRPGGLGWLYLIEEPGGLFWESIEILREVMRDEPRDIARMALQAIGIAPNRVFYMLDHVMAPINIRLTAGEIDDCLRESGASGIRRLGRGADFDRIERIHRGERYAGEKFGIGENRFVFTK